MGRARPRFRGTDGEGMGQGDQHAYYVLQAGGSQLVTGQPLKPEEMLDFLSRLNPNETHVVFAGNYDFTMILRHLPVDKIGELLDRESRAYDDGNKTKHHLVEWNGYRLDYIGHKNLTVQWGPYKRVEIHDVFPFFQSSFLTAIKEWEVCTPEEYAIIEAGKAARSDPNIDVTDAATRQYNGLECEILERLMTKFDAAINRIGLSAYPYEGPGAVAASALEKYVGTPHRKRGESDKPPQPPKDMPARAGYYGGRFEITAHGTVRGPVYEYDIVSAYPAAIATLPCVWHSRWVKEDLSDAKMKFGHVNWEPMPHLTEGRTLAPFPVRSKDGSVSFPTHGAGWYWSPEWDQDDLGPYYTHVTSVWSLTNECQCLPFSWVHNLFQARRQYKARGEFGPTQALKLAYNSLYGKMAQTIGKAPWQHLAYAGIVTSKCRSWVYQAALQAPDETLMIATDGVYTRVPLTLSEGKDLGDWEAQTFDEMFFIRPGVYFTPDGAKTKSRGISRQVLEESRDMIVDSFYDGLYAAQRGEYSGWGTKLDFSGLVSLRSAYHRRKIEKAGYFGALPYFLSFNPGPKRHMLHYRDGILRSKPISQTVLYESVPYTSRYTDDDEAQDMVFSAPDKVASEQIPLF